MATGVAGRGSCNGIDRAILETNLGSTGAPLETDLPKAGRCQPDDGSPTSGAAAVESRAARAQAGFPRRGTAGEAVGVSGTSLELCAGCRTASLAHRDARKVPIDSPS